MRRTFNTSPLAIEPRFRVRDTREVKIDVYGRPVTANFNSHLKVSSTEGFLPKVSYRRFLTEGFDRFLVKS